MTRHDTKNPRQPDHHAPAGRRASHPPSHHPAHRPIHHHAKHEHAPAHEHAQHHPHLTPELGPRRKWGRLRRAVVRGLQRPLVRRVFWGTTLALGLVTVAMALVWWRLSSGPIELDIATPWLKAAIEENFGGKHTVSVGGTQLERDENGRVSLRLRDITVRDSDGAVVASAPKAEVGLSGVGLLSGNVRAKSLNLVGAEMAVRIEKDGSVTVFAGANKRPIATAAPALPAAGAAAVVESSVPGPLRAGAEDMAGLLAWIDGLGATGLDGHDLRELGLKNGNLMVDDERNGKHWSFSQINVSLMRPTQGGLTFRLASENKERPWVLSAAVRPLSDGVRALGIEARNVSTSDILLALRLNEGEVEAELPVSASVRAEISSAGVLQRLQGQVIAGRGSVSNRGEEKYRVEVDRADIRFNWDPQTHVFIVPFQVQAGGNQFTMRAMLKAPADGGGVWHFNIRRDDSVIDPVILAANGPIEAEGFAINRVNMEGRIDTNRRRIDLDKGDLSRVDTRPLYNIGLAITGSIDFSGAEPHLAFGIACTRMPGSVLKRIWPIFAAYPVRQWVEEHVFGGIVERTVIAGNAPLSYFHAGGPPMPDDGLSIDMETSGTTLHPVQSLPEIHDADLTVRVVGRHATVSLGRGTVDVAGGRKLNIASGIFEMPDVHPKPAPGQARFRIDGSVPAVAALLSGEGLRDIVGLTLDPASTRGTIGARVNIDLAVGHNVPKDSATYTIAADMTNFAADKMLLGRKVEANTLRVIASKDGYQIEGDVKVNGTPAKLDLEKQKDSDAELHLQAKLDEAARRRFGIDFGRSVTGVIPVTVSGRVTEDASDSKFKVEADLTQAKIDNLLPGWQKPAGKQARATYTLTKTAISTRFDDLSIEGSGADVKGSVEFDSAGDIMSANLPVFALSDGDKVTLKADRGSDGVLRVTMRGDVYDGRNFVKSSLAGEAPDATKRKLTDLDLDIKLGTVAGHNGETLRGLDLRLSRRGGQIRSFTMKSKIGRDTPLDGDLRLRASDNHQVIYFETADAGALFRFTDIYPRMFGGRMWVAMDPPTQEQKPQVGTLSIRNFVVRGEPTLDRVVAGAPGQPRGSVQFTEMHADFTRFAGKMSVRDGVVRGPVVGATVEGQVNYIKNDVHLRGTFVPFYGLNNMFGQIPIVGVFLGGGSNEGLLGITYEATGPPSSPRILVNPVSAIAPGLLRKFIPSPGAFDPNFMPAPR
jgi:hypothetical protein